MLTPRISVGRVTGALLALAMVGAGCSRSSSKPPATTDNRAATTSAAAPGDFGSLQAVCGPGNAKGATDKGVTDSTISVSTMSDPGNTVVPGLNQEFFDTADAFVGWCNAAGGILGRKLGLTKRDAALFNVSAQMVKACQQPSFMLVGNGEALDGTGVAQRVSCGLPEIASYDVSNQAATAPLSVEPIPVPNDESGLSGAMQALAAYDPAAVTHFGMISSTQQSIKDAGNKDKAAAAALNWTNVYYQEAPVFVDNWRPYAQNIQAHNVQVFELLSQASYVAALLKSLSDVGSFPKYALFNTNIYDPALITNAGRALDGFSGGVYVNVAIVPFELADQYPATKQYINLLRQYANGAKPRALGVSAFSAWLLFAESVKACSSNLTRQCVMAHAASTRDWTGGGLHPARQPGNAKTPGGTCFLLMKATAAGFVVDKLITKPNQGIFNCAPTNTVKLKGFPPAGG